MILLDYHLSIKAMKLRIIESYILEALAVFQYLTSQQLLGLLPNMSISTLNRHLRTLKQTSNPMIRSLSLWFSPWKWPLAPVYCLSDRWVKWLTQQWGYSLKNIKRPMGRSSFFAADYYHRIATIDFKISVIKWIKAQQYQLNFFHCYFEREWSNNSHTGILSQSKASLQFDDLQIIPDAIIGYVTPKWSEIILFEQHMGSDAKRAIRQIMWHCRFISKWVVNTKYGSQKNCRVFYIFEHKSCMESVIHRLEKVSGFGEFKKCFSFKTMQDKLNVLVGT